MEPQAPVRAPRRSAGKRRSRPQAERREETMTSILDAAEKLFALHGRDGVTVRAIAKEAAVDSALVHYYFADISGVFRAVFHRKSTIINAIRNRAMDEYEARAGTRMTIEGVLDVFLRPIFETISDNRESWANFAAIVGHTNASHFGGRELMRENFDVIVQRFLDMLMRLAPEVPPRDIYWFFHLVSATLTHSLAQTGRIDVLSKGLCRSSDMMAVLDMMVEVHSAGFKAIRRRVRRAGADR